MPKINVNKDLFKKIKSHVEQAGYSSIEEFVTNCIEKEIKVSEQAQDEDAIKKRLQGLGYV